MCSLKQKQIIVLLILTTTLQGCNAAPTESPVAPNVAPTTVSTTPDATIQAIRAAEVDVHEAMMTLKDYLTALNEGRYDDAVPLFGGSYDVLIDQNADIVADNRSALFESGCTVNGYQCLTPRSIMYDPPPLSSTELCFVVEFEQSDGSLFARMPRPGETVEPESRFIFIVVKDGDTWKVRDLPPYVA
jgi:hypothetical protein